EANKLAELFSATSFFKESAPIALVSRVDDRQFGPVFMNLFETQFTRVIQMCKSFATFNSINECDKLTLIKGGAFNVFTMRTVPYYDRTNHAWTITLNNESTVMFDLKLFKRFPTNVFVWLKKFLNQIDQEWETDIIVLDLLTAIVLFNPDRPNLEHKNFVKLQQNIYMYLLQRYLAVRYQSQTESTLKFVKLLNCLKVLNVLSDNLRLSMEYKDPDHVPPLMKDILDINEKRSGNTCDGCAGATVTSNNIVVF
ncbi:unnamed protein product, partial [Oppiella nova]